MLRIKYHCNMTKKSSQGDFVARSPAFFPKALLDLKTCFKFLMFYIRWAHGLVFPCQPVSPYSGGGIFGMSSLVTLSILTFRIVYRSGLQHLWISFFYNYVAFCCLALLPCQSVLKRGCLGECKSQ